MSTYREPVKELEVVQGGPGILTGLRFVGVAIDAATQQRQGRESTMAPGANYR